MDPLKIHLNRGCIVTLDKLLDHENGLSVEYTVVRKGTLSKYKLKKSFSKLVSFFLEQAVYHYKVKEGSYDKHQAKRLARYQRWMDKNVCLVVPDKL